MVCGLPFQNALSKNTLLKHDQSLRQVRMGFESRPPIVLCRVLREFHQAQAGG